MVRRELRGIKGEETLRNVLYKKRIYFSMKKQNSKNIKEHSKIKIEVSKK